MAEQYRCSPGGIGYALSLHFLSKGYRVFATVRSAQKLEIPAAKGIDVLELDVTQPASIAAAKDIVRERTDGRLDVLVNNAGAWIESAALDTDISAIKDMYDVNVFGPMEMVRQFTPLLLPVKGTIVNIGSILGIIPYPFTSAYNASKAALAQYSETLRLELEPTGIKVVTVVTGQVRTNLVALPTLEETSIYKPLEPALRDRAKAHIENSMDSETYAVALVNHVTASYPKPWLWKGTNSMVTWVVSTFAHKTAFVGRCHCEILS
ncbi:hypothetical protein V1520DRAFT_284770 [Lipomyces starkeyi]|uniref:NADPH-dependent 1-acyldihydroxyacetone phosphate reductase n=1 Tax=Lipomyces starkeyi NRRL Y-11557 TaxID=675824 RepID=A0A1E3Q3K7_LIPST|nr:hypothetical protein LIPSTDRAFT_54880 [Lipomyces starkeyi NRRL Y-11557]